MRPVLSPETKAKLDAEHWETIDVLMDRAGRAVANAAVGMGIKYGRSVCVLVGPGNNGGDGYVAARLLHQRGAAVRVIQLHPPKSAPALRAGAAAVRDGVRVTAVDARRAPPPSVPSCDLVIDAAFGGVFRPVPAGPLAAWIPQATPVLSVDVPSGLDPHDGSVLNEVVMADRTVTFHALAPGHLLGKGPDHCGHVDVADIGLKGGTAEMWLAGDEDLKLPHRSRTAHKWSAGSVLVVGGDEGMIGAAVMAARSALHFGAGSVGVATTRPELCQQVAPELLAHHIDDPPGRYDVILAGPGLRMPRDELVNHDGPLVLDAGALHADLNLAGRVHDTVLTPHAGELARLGGRSDSKAPGLTVIHKGNPTVVHGEGEPVVVNTGGPELASIGTGDVLAGMVAALLARGVEGRSAAITAAYLHGVAACGLAARRTVTADLLVDEIGAYAWRPAR